MPLFDRTPAEPRALPELDLEPHTQVRTATFALG